MREDERYCELRGAFTAAELMTPRDRLLCWEVGTPREPVIIEAQRQRFSQVPVIDAKDKIVGVIMVEQLHRANAGDAVQKPEWTQWLVSADTSVRRLIEVFTESGSRARFVLREDRILGIVTPADLNKAACRAYLFLLLAQMERQLAELVRKHYRDSDAILNALDDCHRTGVIRRRKRMEAADVALDPIEHFCLPDLINVVENTPEILSLLGGSSTYDLLSDLHGLRDLRNRVAHPVRPVLPRLDAVSALRDCCETLDGIIARLAHLLLAQ